MKRSVILTDRVGPDIFLAGVLNERASFASRTRAFEGARLLNCFECASD